MIGELLGYPACCRDFFRDVWVEHGMIDTTWPQAMNSGAAEGGMIETPAAPETNVLWRWMGVRAVPHLPCSFSCEPTVELGKNFVQVGRDNGYEQEMDWLMEILSWPIEWSCMHGILELKTPIMKVSASTDATAGKHVVRLSGDAYPEQGAQGLNFPFLVPRAPKLTSTIHFKRGLEHPIANSEAAAGNG